MDGAWPQDVETVVGPRTSLSKEDIPAQMHCCDVHCRPHTENMKGK